jgi:hypothetical protein
VAARRDALAADPGRDPGAHGYRQVSDWLWVKVKRLIRRVQKGAQHRTSICLKLAVSRRFAGPAGLDPRDLLQFYLTFFIIKLSKNK